MNDAASNASSLDLAAELDVHRVDGFVLLHGDSCTWRVLA